MAIGAALREAGIDYWTFLGEANNVGYTTVGVGTDANDLYSSAENDALATDQTGTILGEWNQFLANPDSYDGWRSPDCASFRFNELWNAHGSHRLDPKYHLFKLEAGQHVPPGWIRGRLGDILERREEIPEFDMQPNRLFTVMTIAQTGEIRAREAGKGRSPPEWRGSYFEESPGTWYTARAGDVVFSSIDLWKGCIALVPEQFDGALVTKEFPIYRVNDDRLLPAFLQALLRSRYYQRAFRAITTGHSNRRRTQIADFEELGIAFPASRTDQQRLIAGINAARAQQRNATVALEASLSQFSDLIDGRGQEQPRENGEE